MEPCVKMAALEHKKRLEKGVRVLTLIENRRRVTGDPNLDLAAERLIVERELQDLEAASFAQTAVRASPAMDVVIPVRRVIALETVR